MMQREHFENEIHRNEAKSVQIKKQLDQIGWLRVGTFILGIISLVWGNLQSNRLGYVIGSILLVGFLFLVRKYHMIDEERKYYEAEKAVYEDYLARLGEGWKAFEDNGDSFKGENSKAKDLDLLGRSSLYQYLCTAQTPYGKKLLAEAIVTGQKEKKEINKRQEAVRELIQDEGFAIHLQTLSMKMKLSREEQKEETLEQFIEASESQSVQVSKWLKGLAYVLPFATLFCLVVGLMGYRPSQNFTLVEIGFVLQLALTFSQAGKASKQFGPLFAFNKNINVYKDFIKSMQNKDYTSTYLQALQKELLKNGGAVLGMTALNKLTDQIKVRYNFIANILLNGFLMWNVHCMDALGIWQKQYGNDIRGWLKAMGEMEALLSLAVIGRVKSNYVFPDIIESSLPEFKFENMTHPLISEEKVVGNDAEFREATCIITGSNMSGKTTFLRSIGVNLALAYAGAPVTAKQFSTSYMEVFTSMRIEDRVDEGISTFYAELLRIKEMIEYSQRHLPMLTLIDEIFKGTNSADRILGAAETIKKLGKPWVNVMVTTHDFELCNLEKEEKRKTYNYHFEEYYKDNQIMFDYKLRKERCQTTNAKYLLRMVGILD